MPKLSGAQLQVVARAGSALAWLIVVQILHWIFPLPEDLVRMVQGGFIALILQGISRPAISMKMHPEDDAKPQPEKG
jgi:hypothetical protein